MFDNAIKLFKLAGFEVRMHFSWLIIFALLTWSLASGLFPALAPGLSVPVYWGLAAVSVLVLFFCVVLHELAHSVVARRNGLPMKGITLFVFGGVAEMTDEPRTPGAEFTMAAAGPAASFALAAAFYVIYLFGVQSQWPLHGIVMVYYLALINAVLAIFNMIPAFPLDGGRMLRAFLWHRRNDIRSATRSAAAVGAAFSLILIFLGILSILGGNLIAGVWWIVIGMFLQSAASAARQQMDARMALQGQSVERFLKRDSALVHPSISLREFIDDYVYRYNLDTFPVVDSYGKLVGHAAAKDIRDIPADERDYRTVGEIAHLQPAENTISIEASANEALAAMHRTGHTNLIVKDQGRVAGTVSLKDLMSYVALRLELGDGDVPPTRLDKAA